MSSDWKQVPSSSSQESRRAERVRGATLQECSGLFVVIFSPSKKGREKGISFVVYLKTSLYYESNLTSRLGIAEPTLSEPIRILADWMRSRQ